MSSYPRRCFVFAIALALSAPLALAEIAVRVSDPPGKVEEARSLREVIPLSSPLGAPPSLRAADSIARAPQALQELGVGWFGLTRTLDGARLGLYTPGGTEIGAFAVRHRAGEGRTLSPEWLDGRFEDPQALTVTVWNDARGGLLGHFVPGQNQLGAIDDDGLRSVTSQSVTCSRNWIYYSGLHIGLTRSAACERATLDVNGRCSNSACWGCCEQLECDCACAAGDFSCVCVRGGYACALEGCEYQIIPDPETCDPLGGGSTGGTGGGDGSWDPNAGSGGGSTTTCVDVYCEDTYAGQACGSTTEEIVEAAYDMC